MSDSSGGEDPRERLETLLRSTLPMDEVVYAFGYGSGVFSQQIDKEREDRETKVVDLIVVVRTTWPSIVPMWHSTRRITGWYRAFRTRRVGARGGSVTDLPGGWDGIPVFTFC